jgi:hypothetical protein
MSFVTDCRLIMSHIVHLFLRYHPQVKLTKNAEIPTSQSSLIQSPGNEMWNDYPLMEWKSIFLWTFVVRMNLGWKFWENSNPGWETAVNRGSRGRNSPNCLFCHRDLRNSKIILISQFHNLTIWSIESNQFRQYFDQFDWSWIIQTFPQKMKDSVEGKKHGRFIGNRKKKVE